MSAKVSDRYTYRVFWSEEDSAYIGLCAELPSMSHVDDTIEAAIAGIRDLAAFTVDDLAESGEAVPEPLHSRRYSGHLNLRVPPETHRALVVAAAEAGVSLNRLVSERLAQAAR